MREKAPTACDDDQTGNRTSKKFRLERKVLFCSIECKRAETCFFLFFVFRFIFKRNDSSVNGIKKGIFYLVANKFNLGGSPGLEVIGGESHSRGCGFESEVRILDGNFSQWSIVHIVFGQTLTGTIFVLI